jgi:hypothetical protein
LRSRLFGARLRIVVEGQGEAAATTLRRAGIPDVRVEGDALSIGVDDARVSAPRIVRLLVEGGAAIVAVTPEEPPLEEVYLRLLAEGDA